MSRWWISVWLISEELIHSILIEHLLSIGTILGTGDYRGELNRRKPSAFIELTF